MMPKYHVYNEYFERVPLQQALTDLGYAPAAHPISAVDWSNAPDWAQWHAFDRDGMGAWFAAQPNPVDMGVWDSCAASSGSPYAMPAHYAAWRDSLTQRSQPEQPVDDDAAALRARVVELETANADTAHKLRVALTQLDWARGARDEYAAKIDKLRTEQRALRVQLEEQHRATQQVDAAKQRAELQLDDANAECGRLAYDLAAACNERDNLREQVAISWESIRKLKAILSDSGEYSINRADGAPIGLGEAIRIGNVFESIDKWLDANRPATPD